MSPERDREQNVLNRQTAQTLIFLSKKEKCLRLDLFHLSDRRPLMSLCFFFSNNEGWIFWPSPTPVSMCILVCVHACYSLHSTPHNNTVYLQGPSQTGLCSKRASHGWDEGALWLLLLLTTSISCTPRAKTKPFLATRQHFRDPIVAPRACLSQSSGYSLCFCVSMGSWMFPQCIWVKAKTAFRAAFRETDGVARKDAAPICLKYLAALIYFD